MVEKPFGHDLDSARALNRTLGELFHESQIFRIDHYLGKETVQNILAFRFANTLFEPIWNRHYIDHVQITVAEAVGVGNRGHYYDQAGALRDMVQNHLLQSCASSPWSRPSPSTPTKSGTRKWTCSTPSVPFRRSRSIISRCGANTGPAGSRANRSRAIAPNPTCPPIPPRDLCRGEALGGQLALAGGALLSAHRQEMPAKISEVSIQFRPVPHQTFPASAVMDSRPNRLLIAIQPEEGILLRFEAKYPGPTMRLSPVMMQFYYREAFKSPPPEAYETLLLDVMLGDATLFMRADQTEAAWSYSPPFWRSGKPSSPPTFPTIRRHLGSGGGRDPPGPGRPQLGDAHLPPMSGRQARLPGDHGSAMIGSSPTRSP